MARRTRIAFSPPPMRLPSLPGPDPVATMALGDGSVVDLRRRSTSPPTTGTTGDIAAMALYAGMGVGAMTGRKPAAEIVAELCQGLGA